MLASADVVVDVANSPSWEPAAVLDFFERSSKNLVAAEAIAGVKHHVALSIVGTDRSPDIPISGPSSPRRRHQIFFDPLLDRACHPVLRISRRHRRNGRDGRQVVVPSALFQPIAADDVVDCLAEVAQGGR